MGRTRTSGITTDANGNKLINKLVLGQTIFARLGKVSQEQAEEELARRIAAIRHQQSSQCAEPTFAAAATRFLTEAQADGAKNLEGDAWHVTLLAPFIGALPLSQICDDTLAEFKQKRYASGVSRTTVKRSLEVVRKILNRSHRKWRMAPDYKRPWLLAVPEITMPKLIDVRAPRPLTWDEQVRLIPLLPAHLQRMILFALNTGLRDGELCGLRWEWEQQVPELGTSVFVLPGASTKNGEARVVVLNDTARRIIDEVRGQHPEYVFVYTHNRGRAGEKGLRRPNHQSKPSHPIGTMNNNGWQKARRLAGVPDVRVHDLRHTFARRLRAAGVPPWTRKALIGHKTGDITEHYSPAELGELLAAVNKLDATRGAPQVTLLRTPASLAESLAPRKKAS